MAGFCDLMAAGGIGWQLNIDVRSLSQSIMGKGAWVIESAGSSAPYCLAMEARMVRAFTPASLLMVHLPSLSNHWPPAWTTIGWSWIMVHCDENMANLNPCRTNLLPSLMASFRATSPSWA